MHERTHFHKASHIFFGNYAHMACFHIIKKQYNLCCVAEGSYFHTFVDKHCCIKYLLMQLLVTRGYYVLWNSYKADSKQKCCWISSAILTLLPQNNRKSCNGPEVAFCIVSFILLQLKFKRLQSLRAGLQSTLLKWLLYHQIVANTQPYKCVSM